MRRAFPNAALLFFAVFSFVLLAFSQDTLLQAPAFEVNRMLPFVSINYAQLTEANTLLDINPRYDADWVKTYQSVEVTTIQKGRVLTKVGTDGTLTGAQKKQLAAADLGTEISVLVRYMPENNLKHNDLQEMNFSFSVEADQDAQFVGGDTQLKRYLFENAIQHLSAESFGEWGMSAVTFEVDEKGFIGAVEAVDPVQDTTTSLLLIETICNMPQWQPARYNTGVTVAQQFALTVGNQGNCKIALLNTRGLN